MVKIKVFVSHRPVGWLREIGGEVVLTTTSVKATSYRNPCDIGHPMERLQAPDPDSANPRRPLPTLTFQLVRV